MHQKDTTQEFGQKQQIKSKSSILKDIFNSKVEINKVSTRKLYKEYINLTAGLSKR